MNVRAEVVCVGVDGTEERRDVLTIDRAQLVMETLGMNLKEGKALLEGVQELMIATKSMNIWSNSCFVRRAANGAQAKIPASRR
jgi:hypothetical protein